LLVILFLLGYIGIISQSLYEIIVGRAKAWGDIVAALLVLIYWDSIAFCYAHANKRLGLKSVVFFLPEKLSIYASKGQSRTKSQTAGNESTETVKFQGLSELKERDHAHEILEMQTPTEDSPFDSPRQHARSGVERIEGPRVYVPFFAMDTLEDSSRPDEAESIAKTIFNPFQPASSPSLSGNFDFSPIRLPDETPTPRSDIAIDYPPHTLVGGGIEERDKRDFPSCTVTLTNMSLTLSAPESPGPDPEE